MRISKLVSALGLAGTLTLITVPSNAGVVFPTVTVNTEITQMDLSGVGLVPLVTDPGNLLGDSIEGYGFLNSSVSITESSTQTSSGSTTITFDGSSISVSASFSLFLDVVLTDTDSRPGRDFAGQSDGGSIALTASAPVNAMTITQTASLDLNALFAAISGATTDAELIAGLLGATVVDPNTTTRAEYALGFDVNSNSVNDVVKLGLSDLSFASDDLNFELAGGSFDALLANILTGTVVDPIVIGANVAISSASVTFAGLVRDELTDPPFTLGTIGTVTGTTAAVPAPAPFALLLAGVVALGARRLLHRS